MAFTQNTSVTLAKQPRKGLVQIANGDGTGNKTVIAAGANGSKVASLMAASTDTSARDVQVSLVRGGTTYPLGVTNVPITAGTIAATPPVNLLAAIAGLPVDNDGQKYLFLESGDTLVVSALIAVTSAKLISVHADYADF